MPGYRSHIAAGAALAGGIIIGTTYMGWFDAEPIYIAVLITIATLAALFPDADEPKTQVAFYVILAALDTTLIIHEHYRWASIVGLFAMFPVLCKIKGWPHAWWAMLLVPAPIMALPWVFFRTSWEDTLPFYAAAVAGYLSHLIVDKAA